MSRFLDECAAFVRTLPVCPIRIAEARADGSAETVAFQPANACQNVYSVAKAFAMTAVGLLWDRGLLRLEDKVCGLLAEELPERGMDERWRGSTVEMALTHRLGLPEGFLDIDVTPSAQFGRDYLRYMLTWPLAYEPGAESRYSDGAYYLISRIVEKKAGLPLDDFLWRELLFPLGFQEMAWSHCPMGHPMGATGLYIGAADMAKLGLLYLNGGVYEGRRLLSQAWTRLAPEKGYAFYDVDDGLYGKGGMHGQMLLVDARRRRAVAVQAYDADTGAIVGWIREHRAL